MQRFGWAYFNKNWYVNSFWDATRIWKKHKF